MSPRHARDESNAGAHREAFRAMGCHGSIVVNGPHRLIAVGRAHVDELERAWSRFLPDSDVARLNLAGGVAQRVEPSTVRLVTAMVDAWRATGGAFDPTLLAPLVALGYGGSRESSSGSTSLCARTSWRGRPERIRVDAAASTVQLPPHMALDPGGIGKGLAADIVADAVIGAGARGVLVELGGDIAVRGAAAGGGGWCIAVGDGDAGGDGDEDCLRLLAGGVATSGTGTRARVAPDGTVAHHLLDPARGAPVAGVARTATVVAGTAAWAEAWTKAVVVAGAGGWMGVLDLLDRLDDLGLAARVRGVDGAIRHNRAWEAFAATAGAGR